MEAILKIVFADFWFFSHNFRAMPAFEIAKDIECLLVFF